jgi:hypothetical protein
MGEAPLLAGVARKGRARLDDWFVLGLAERDFGVRKTIDWTKNTYDKLGIVVYQLYGHPVGGRSPFSREAEKRAAAHMATMESEDHQD